MCGDFELFKKRIHAKIGLDLNCYKEKQLKRRIIQFMARHNTESFSQFLAMLDTDSALLQNFKGFLTINTSEFFRDVKVFDYIKTKIIPELSTQGSGIKIWSAGCSIGAEPYSLAILAREAGLRNVQILATDYDKSILEKANAGIYNANTIKNIPAELTARYFDRADDKYIIRGAVKQDVVFKEQNLLKDVFPVGFDLILCRNVFIYFTQEAQQELISRFIRSLKPGGFFIIGSSEFISAPDSLGCNKCCPSVYRKAKQA